MAPLCLGGGSCSLADMSYFSLHISSLLCVIVSHAHQLCGDLVLDSVLTCVSVCLGQVQRRHVKTPTIYVHCSLSIFPVQWTGHQFNSFNRTGLIRQSDCAWRNVHKSVKFLLSS